MKARTLCPSPRPGLSGDHDVNTVIEDRRPSPHPEPGHRTTRPERPGSPRVVRVAVRGERPAHFLGLAPGDPPSVLGSPRRGSCECPVGVHDVVERAALVIEQGSQRLDVGADGAGVAARYRAAQRGIGALGQGSIQRGGEQRAEGGGAVVDARMRTACPTSVTRWLAPWASAAW